jgi:hypothetical protein
MLDISPSDEGIEHREPPRGLRPWRILHVAAEATGLDPRIGRPWMKMGAHVRAREKPIGRKQVTDIAYCFADVIPPGAIEIFCVCG